MAPTSTYDNGAGSEYKTVNATPANSNCMVLDMIWRLPDLTSRCQSASALTFPGFISIMADRMLPAVTSQDLAKYSAQPRKRLARRYRQTARHTIDIDDDQWIAASKLAESMRPRSKPSLVLQWILDEGLKREWEAAIAAGAIVVDDPKP